MKNLRPILLAITFLLYMQSLCSAIGYNGGIKHDVVSKTIKIADPNQNLLLVIDYAKGCKITQLDIRGKNTLSPSGIYTGVKTKEGAYSSSIDANSIKVIEDKKSISINNIEYGDVKESWIFKLTDNKILWEISREYIKSIELDEMEFPKWNFSDLSVWKGGIMDNGGMVWCKYLSKVDDTYGVHTAGVTFWNPDSGNALRIDAKSANGKYLAAKYSHSNTGEFVCTQYVTDTELKQRYNLNRFVHQKSDVFAPFRVEKGNTTIFLELQYIDYTAQYSRGTLPGIDAEAVRELLNTTGRYGVVDNNIIGANGWTTNWKCLHEPFFAQIGMALNDDNYTRNMSSTLDQERDLAMLPDGRVLSRWHNAAGDEIPGTFDSETGYYEAMWGYTIDSQTGYVINTSEQFDLCGDLNWLKSHKVSCEKALDWLIKRDSNNNGIFEMMNNTIAEKKASDWLDIVWASFENAFVNAQMYEALNLWANCEQILGDKQKVDYYLSVASRLKSAFNKPVNEGGFWVPEKKQYIYWRDKDGSIHGDNLVTPVNFAVIAFGLCDDKERVSMILDQIEKRTSAENLFHWPLCFDSYKREEVHNNNWPFPKYENGDIFPTWGYMGVRAYVNYDKAIALKYIRNILQQYNKDGLSSQRYSRVTQLGLGDDILAGICTSVTALYRDIYGIRPKWNRMGLEPNMSEILNGTQFSYKHLGTAYKLRLSVNDYLMSTDAFSIRSNSSFGARKVGAELRYYPENKDNMIFTINASSVRPINMEIKKWEDGEYSWTISSVDQYEFKFTGLQPNLRFRLLINNKSQNVMSDEAGNIVINNKVKLPTTFSLKESK